MAKTPAPPIDTEIVPQPRRVGPVQKPSPSVRGKVDAESTKQNSQKSGSRPTRR
jgi:hypothetical protein